MCYDSAYACVCCTSVFSVCYINPLVPSQVKLQAARALRNNSSLSIVRQRVLKMSELRKLQEIMSRARDPLLIENVDVLIVSACSAKGKETAHTLTRPLFFSAY